MATVQEAIVSKLKASAALTAKVKNRIRPLAFTQLDKRPCVAYSQLDTEKFETMTGTADYRRVTFQIDIFADDYASCESIGGIIESVLHNYKGTTEGIQFAFVKHKGDSDETEPPDVGEQQVIHRLQSSYLILYREV